MLCQVVMVHYSLWEMVYSSVRNKMFSVYVTLGIDSVDSFPSPCSVLYLSQYCLPNKDLYLFCMAWRGNLWESSSHGTDKIGACHHGRVFHCSWRMMWEGCFCFCGGSRDLELLFWPLQGRATWITAQSLAWTRRMASSWALSPIGLLKGRYRLSILNP